MDNPQYYQPLSAALHAPHIQQGRPPTANAPQYSNYSSHAPPSAAGGIANTHREEEEEEEDDDEEVVEEELEHHDQDRHQSSSHSSPRTSANQRHQSNAATAGQSSFSAHQQPTHDASNAEADGIEKRKPGRPRGSRNRKPRVAPAAPIKAPANSQHPGFYQYPPAPGANGVPQNQQFYEFQWRALNLCNEFYNAAEELIKAASPMVIAQCYQMGPGAKIDPLALIADAKRVCDSLLANPSQLVGSSPPVLYPSVPSYQVMPPPPPSTASTSAPVITNPQSFVMSLGAPSISAPTPTAYYPPPMYAPPGSRYPTTPYYSYPPQPGQSYYPPPPQPTTPTVNTPISAPPPPAPAPPPPAPAPAPVPTPPAPAPVTSAPPTTTGTISTFNAATGNIAPGGQSGTWSDEETERLRKLSEQSKDMSGAQGKGEIDWDWVVHQWGNTRTRHQVLLKATSMGLKESTTRGTKRRRDNDTPADGNANNNAHPPPAPTITTTTSPPVAHTASPATTSTAATSPAVARPPSTPVTSATTINPARTTNSGQPNPPPPTTAGNLSWPMPTIAANTPSPVMAHAQTETSRTAAPYYRSRPTSGATSYTAAATGSPTMANPRPPTSAGGTAPQHPYMYRPNGATGSQRENGR